MLDLGLNSSNSRAASVILQLLNSAQEPLGNVTTQLWQRAKYVIGSGASLLVHSESHHRGGMDVVGVIVALGSFLAFFGTGWHFLSYSLYRNLAGKDKDIRVQVNSAAYM